MMNTVMIMVVYIYIDINEFNAMKKLYDNNK